MTPRYIVIAVHAGPEAALGKGNREMFTVSHGFDLPDGMVEDIVEHLKLEATRLVKDWERHLLENRQ